MGLVRNPKLRKSPVVLSKLVEVATHKNLRRGRQPFVMSLGFVSARFHAERISVFLADPDVEGHVMNALIKMKVAGYAREAKLLMTSEKVWKRKVAKRYLERYPDA